MVCLLYEWELAGYAEIADCRVIYELTRLFAQSIFLLVKLHRSDNTMLQFLAVYW